MHRPAHPIARRIRSPNIRACKRSRPSAFQQRGVLRKHRHQPLYAPRAKLIHLQVITETPQRQQGLCGRIGRNCASIRVLNSGVKERVLLRIGHRVGQRNCDRIKRLNAAQRIGQHHALGLEQRTVDIKRPAGDEQDGAVAPLHVDVAGAQHGAAALNPPPLGRRLVCVGIGCCGYTRKTCFFHKLAHSVSQTMHL